MSARHALLGIVCFLRGHVFELTERLDGHAWLETCTRCQARYAVYRTVSDSGHTSSTRRARWTEHHAGLWAFERFNRLDDAALHCLSVRENRAVWTRQITERGGRPVWAASLVDMDGEPRSSTYYGRHPDEACRRLFWALRS